MKYAQRFRKGCLVVLAGLALGGTAHAGLLSDRWAKVGQWDEAIAGAKKADKPLAILYGLDNYASTTVGEDTALNYFMGEKSLEPFVRVFNSTQDRDVKVAPFFPQANKTGGDTPELYFVEPHTMRLIGFVDYSNFNDTPKVARSALDLMKWLDKSNKEIERADRSAGNAQFKTALRSLDKVNEEDAKISKALEQHLGVPYDPDRKPRSTAPEPHSQAGEPARDEGADKKDAKTEASDKSEKDAGKGTFFPKLLQTKRDAYDKLAAARVATARAELANKNFVKAKAALQIMVTDGSDLPSIATAKSLLDEIVAAEKAAKSK